MSKTILKRMKHYQFWVYISAFVLLAADTLGFKIVADDYNNLVNGFLGLLVMIGVLTSEPLPQNEEEKPPTVE